MRISWSFAAAIAGTAFFISAVVAALAGVSFGVLLLRAIISGVVFGAVGIGAEVLVQHQLPELYAAIRGEQQPASPASAEESGGGEGVDIVLESEEQQSEAEFGSETLAAGGEQGDDVPVPPTDDLVEEVEEATSESEPDEAENPAAPTEEAAETGESSSVESLPDIGEFSETFQSDTSESSSTSGSESDPGQGSAQGRSAGEEPRGSGSEDPAAIARAIQTVLKRDE